MGMGGKMVIGGLVALGVAEGVKDYKKISTSRKMDSYARQHVLQGITSGRLPVPQGTASVQDMRTGQSYGVPQ